MYVDVQGMNVVFFKHRNSRTRRCLSVTAKFIECFGENTFQFVPHQVFIQASGRGYLRKKKVRRWQRARTNKTLTQRMSSAMITFRRYLQESVGDYRLRAIIMLLFLHSVHTYLLDNVRFRFEFRFFIRTRKNRI